MQGIQVLGLQQFYRAKVVDIEQLDLQIGKSYGLIGTNGVGKTTFLKLLSGIIEPDCGQINLNNLKVEMVYHESGLFQQLTIYENIFLNREFIKSYGPIKKIDWKKVIKETEKLLKKNKLNVDPYSKAKNVDLGTQKIIEVVVAISKNPDILIIDEPLALLDVEQIELLNRLLKVFQNGQKMIIYSSHRVDRMIGTVDEVLVMRSGQIVDRKASSEQNLVQLWEFSERDIHKYPKRIVKHGDTLLKVNNLKTEKLSRIQFDLAEKEILGIIGLKGAYKSDIGRAIFGAIPHQGKVYLEGRLIKTKSTSQAVEAGICYIGNSQEGLFVEDSVYDNIISANGKRARKLNKKAKEIITKYYLDLLNVGSHTMGKQLNHLSAGSKQKVLLAKWFFSNAKVFIFDKPTANIDASSKVDVYNIFSDLAESGAGIVIISNDLEEIAGICDRVISIGKGGITREIERNDLTVHHLIEALQNWV